MLPIRFAPAWLATCLAAGSAIPDFSAQGLKPERDVPAKTGVAGPRAGDPHEEMQKLFGQVELRLREIDRLLSDAAAGSPRARAQAGSAGMGELLVKSRDRAQQVVEDFDRILELADHPHPPGGT